MRWLWYGIAYSFAGFLLEVAFARAIRHPKRDRKCCLFLPLCPVYGLGAVAILALPDAVAGRWPLLWLAGGAAATAVEYALGWFYESTLGVRFWDYSALPGSLGGGKVCLPFSCAWGALAVALRRWLHPLLAPLLDALPASWAPLAVTVLVLDGWATLAVLSRTGTTDALRWYDLTAAPARPGYPPPSDGGESPPPVR